MKIVRCRLAEEAAAITLVSAALILVMLLTGAVLFDVMVVYRAKGEAQTAADAAAKAAGLELTPCFGVGNEPEAAAARFAAMNGAQLLDLETEGDGLCGCVRVRVGKICHPLFISFGRTFSVTADAAVYLDPFRE